MNIRAKFTRWYIRKGEPGWAWPLAYWLLSPSIYFYEKARKIYDGKTANVFIVDELASYEADKKGGAG